MNSFLIVTLLCFAGCTAQAESSKCRKTRTVEATCTECIIMANSHFCQLFQTYNCLRTECAE